MRTHQAQTTHWRLLLVFLIFLAAGGAIVGRLFVLQILRYDEYVALAARQNGSEIEPPRRGTIYFQDKDGRRQAAALNKETYTVSAVPKDIDDSAEAAAALAEILQLDMEGLSDRKS